MSRALTKADVFDAPGRTGLHPFLAELPVGTRDVLNNRVTKNRASIRARFMSYVDKGDCSGCWNWTRTQSNLGYGYFYAIRGGGLLAHRVSWEYHVGPVPYGMSLDHLCRNPSCVRPDHLEPVTHRENVLRGVSFAAKHAKKTACPEGHPYDALDTKGRRMCRPCARNRAKANYAKVRASVLDGSMPAEMHGSKRAIWAGCKCDLCSAAKRVAA